jgi:hypothetical protein
LGGVRTEKAVECGDGEDAGGTRPARRSHTRRFGAVTGLADRLADAWAEQLGLPAEKAPNG